MNDNQNRENIRRLVRQAIAEQIQGQPPVSDAVDEMTIDESLKDVITEDDIRRAQPGGRLLIKEDAILTPAAKDLINAQGIEIRYRTRAHGGGRRLIAIGSDHGGFEMKEMLKNQLDRLGIRYRDFGTHSSDPVDYPDFAHAVARAVADGMCDLGIIIDGAGIGSCMTANKVPGVRAAMCYDQATARNSREHNYANVLTLGGKMIEPDKLFEIVKTFLATPEGEERHRKRVAKITAIEKQYLR